jgi:hypothetical protein
LVSSIRKKAEDFTLKRITAVIGQPWAFESQGLSATEGANPPKIKFFDAVARLEPDLVQFSDAPNQSC